MRKERKDLVVLAADKNIDYGIRGLLTRPKSLGTRQIDADSLIHPRHDPGCLREAHNVLRPFAKSYDHALVVFDREGSGRETASRETLEAEVEARLAANGWDDRAAVVVIDPELEVWAFAASPHVAQCLGWPPGRGTLRSWLQRRHLWPAGRSKPEHPRAVFELILREVDRPRSSAVYERLGRRVGLRGCTDAAFYKFSTTLANWFPQPGETRALELL